MDPVSSQLVANEFLALANEAGRELTNMQLQKLVYLAQGYYLALNGVPLTYHNTHAWQWGPVMPKLYKSLQRYGAGAVTELLATPAGETLTEDAKQVITGVWEGYGHRTAASLSALTHQPGTPWSKTWSCDKFGVIPLDEIKLHYRGLIDGAGKTN